MCACSRSASSARCTASASSRRAVTGVRSRWDRSATAARSAARSSVIRSASRFSATPSSRVSGGPSGTARAVSSPPRSRCATSASAVTGVLTRRPSRSAITIATSSSSAPSSAIPIQARTTPWCRTSAETVVRTTSVPAPCTTGTRISAPDASVRVKALPSCARRTDGSRARPGASAPRTVPSAVSTLVRAGPRSSTAVTSSPRRGSSWRLDTRIATLRASWLAAAIATVLGHRAHQQAQRDHERQDDR